MTQDHPKAKEAKMPWPEATSELSDAEMDNVAAGVVTFNVIQNQGTMVQPSATDAARIANFLSFGLKPYGG